MQRTVQGRAAAARVLPSAARRVAAPAAAADRAALQASAAPCLAAIAAACLLVGAPLDAGAAQRTRQPPVDDASGRCSLQTLANFAETRAKFSQEAAGGGMVEAVVDVRACSFRDTDLRGTVWSGVLGRGADLTGSTLAGVQFARADMQDAVLDGVDFSDVNLYATALDGASLRGAQFENAVLTSTSFGKSAVTGKWADLAGAHFEGALLSSSDIGRVCENPTLDAATRAYELGCRTPK